MIFDSLWKPHFLALFPFTSGSRDQAVTAVLQSIIQAQVTAVLQSIIQAQVTALLQSIIQAQVTAVLQSIIQAQVTAVLQSIIQAQVTALLCPVWSLRTVTSQGNANLYIAHNIIVNKYWKMIPQPHLLLSKFDWDVMARSVTTMATRLTADIVY